MTQTSVSLRVPFESLVEAALSLPLEDQMRLRQLLDQQIAQAGDGASETSLEPDLALPLKPEPIAPEPNSTGSSETTTKPNQVRIQVLRGKSSP